MRTLVLFHLFATLNWAHATSATTTRAHAPKHCNGGGSGSSCRGSASSSSSALDDAPSCSGDDDDDGCSSDSDDDDSCDSGDDDSCAGDSDDCNAGGHHGKRGHHALETGLVWASLPVPFAMLLRCRARRRTPH